MNKSSFKPALIQTIISRALKNNIDLLCVGIYNEILKLVLQQIKRESIIFD
jgi:hypothetical protein